MYLNWIETVSRVLSGGGAPQGPTSGAHLVPSSVNNWGFLLGVKQSAYDDIHSPPSTAAVKNGWIYSSTYICLHNI